MTKFDLTLSSLCGPLCGFSHILPLPFNPHYYVHFKFFKSCLFYQTFQLDLKCDLNVFRAIWEALHYPGPLRLSSRLWPFTTKPVSIQQNSRHRKSGLDFQVTLFILYQLFVRQLLTLAFLKKTDRRNWSNGW